MFILYLIVNSKYRVFSLVSSTWNLEDLPKPILIIIQSFLAIAVSVILIKIIFCILPKCKSSQC